MTRSFLSALAALLLAEPCIVVSLPDVNPGFETGNYSGWTPSGNFIPGASVDTKIRPVASGPTPEAALPGLRFGQQPQAHGSRPGETA